MIKLIEKIEGEAKLNFNFKEGRIDFVDIEFMSTRNIENILRGKNAFDALVINPRVCGICGHAHLIATVQALESCYDNLELSNKAKTIRELTLNFELIQNHFKWFYLTMLPHARIDRRRKIPATSLLMALGMDPEEILSTFYNKLTYKRAGDHWRIPFSQDRFRGLKAVTDLVDADRRAKSLSGRARRSLPARPRGFAENGLKAAQLATDEDLIGSYLADDIVNSETGEIFVEAGDEIDERDRSRSCWPPASRKSTCSTSITCNHRSLHPCNTLAVDKNDEPRGSADRYLPRHAPGRAADPGDGRSPVHGPVLRFRTLRPVGRRPRQDEHASRT